jgi:hypothetical protein
VLKWHTQQCETGPVGLEAGGSWSVPAWSAVVGHRRRYRRKRKLSDSRTWCRSSRVGGSIGCPLRIRRASPLVNRALSAGPPRPAERPSREPASSRPRGTVVLLLPSSDPIESVRVLSERNHRSRRFIFDPARTVMPQNRTCRSVASQFVVDGDLGRSPRHLSASHDLEPGDDTGIEQTSSRGVEVVEAIDDVETVNGHVARPRGAEFRQSRGGEGTPL